MRQLLPLLALLTGWSVRGRENMQAMNEQSVLYS
jgi:hypothetical protein